jgi:UDP-glucose 4-epimerase
MKVLVTGTSGFIGSKVFDHLSEDHLVEGIDMVPDNKRTRYVFNLSEEKWIDFLPNDYDYIVHCAAQSGGYISLVEPVLDCDWNCRATVNVTNFVKKNKSLKKIIFTSSMAVYGNGRNKTEESSLSPISYYAVSKLAGEGYIKLCWEHRQIPYTIFRLWNTYGGGQDLDNKFQGMLSIYLAQALQSEVIKIKGDKERIRDFIHVDDVVSAISLSIENHEAFDNQVFNLCTGVETSSDQLIQKISSALNKKLEIEQIRGYVGDQFHSSGLNTKLVKNRLVT